MALSKAVEFVQYAGFNKDLRMTCNKCESKYELLQKLEFSEDEFENAVNMQLVKCRTYEEAEIYQQVRLWFLLL